MPQVEVLIGTFQDESFYLESGDQALVSGKRGFLVIRDLGKGSNSVDKLSSIDEFHPYHGQIFRSYDRIFRVHH